VIKRKGKKRFDRQSHAPPSVDFEQEPQRKARRHQRPVGQSDKPLSLDLARQYFRQSTGFKKRSTQEHVRECTGRWRGHYAYRGCACDYSEEEGREKALAGRTMRKLGEVSVAKLLWFAGVSLPLMALWTWYNFVSV
jgi:hypothetical protein